MNVFICGSSSILASALIEFYFGAGNKLFLCDEIPTEEEQVETFLKKKTDGQQMDLIFLLQSEELLRCRLSRRTLRVKAKRQEQFNTFLCQYFAGLSAKPQAIITSSSVLIYQALENEKSFEQSPVSQDFPAEYFQHLESATKAAEQCGIRCIHLRLGQLVSKTTEPVYARLPLLDGHVPLVIQKNKQNISWVSREDALRAVIYILEQTSIDGPVNVTSGDVLPKHEFFKIAAINFHLRRTIPLPGAFYRMFFGKEAMEILMKGASAIPFLLMDSGFFFEDISLQEYLAPENGKQPGLY